VNQALRSLLKDEERGRIEFMFGSSSIDLLPLRIITVIHLLSKTNLRTTLNIFSCFALLIATAVAHPKWNANQILKHVAAKNI